MSGLHAILGGLASRFQIFTGTSVGAINAAHFAAHAHLADLGTRELAARYAELRLSTHLRPHLPVLPRLGDFARSRSRRKRGAVKPVTSAARHGWALLDPRPFEDIVCNHIPWHRLHANVLESRVRALIISGLRISDGRTTTFAELSPGADFALTHDPRRDAVVGPITAEHVLASAALPLLFPARRIGEAYYCDGGLRFNTPMAPAIRAGADRLVVIALRSSRPPEAVSVAQYPNPFFLMGKVLDALLLDPIEYDLHVLDRLNRMVEVMEETMAPPVLERVRRVLEKHRGLPYEQLRTLVFHPSDDIGVLAGEYMRSELPSRREGLVARMFLRHAGALGAQVEADFVSYLLFDGGFARVLMELGYRDALARAEEIRDFFGEPPRTAEIAPETSA